MLPRQAPARPTGRSGGATLPGGRHRGGGWHSGCVDRWNDLRAVPGGYGPSVVTIGNFDGVHLGHQAVLRQVVARARRDGATAVAVTFDPHPLAVLYPDRAPEPLGTLDHRLELMAATGLAGVLVMEFTLELASWSPERFVREVLVETLGACAVVVGRDMRFGHRNTGDVSTLRELGQQYGFTVELIEDLGGQDDAEHPGGQVDGHRSGRRWSSTWVRELIAAGDVDRAAEVLGHPHRVTGVVVHGDHRGRELGYPTANLSPDAVGVVPQDGVYAGWLLRLDPAGTGESERLPAAISIGTNPTFDGASRRVEAYVLDRDDLDLYGTTVGVEFTVRLRPTLRFDGVDALIRQMKVDVEQCHQVLRVAGAGR